MKGEELLPASAQQRVLLGVAVGCLLLAMILWFKSRPYPVKIEKAYALYTIDDGQTYFRAALDVPPFYYRGKEAVEAFVFTCGHGAPFVAYLVKYTPERQAELRTMLRRSERYDNRGLGGMLIKKPGPGSWLNLAPSGNPATMTPDERQSIGDHVKEATALRNVQCPDGAEPDRANPQPAR